MAVGFGGNNTSGPIDVATAVNAHGGPAGRLDFESETFIAFNSREDPEVTWDRSGPLGASSPQAQSIAFDTTQITSKANRSQPKPGDPCHPLAAGAHAPAIAIQAGALRENPASGPDGIGVQSDVAYTVEARAEVQAVAFNPKMGGDPSMGLGVNADGTAYTIDHSGNSNAVAFTCSEQANSFAWERDVWQTLDAQIPNDSSNIQKGVRQGWAVRRLMPIECERLQGFPDGYTAIPYRGKPAADGPRYKALGNSWAVNVARWVGRRIEMIEQIAAEKRRSAA